MSDLKQFWAHVRNTALGSRSAPVLHNEQSTDRADAKQSNLHTLSECLTQSMRPDLLPRSYLPLCALPTCTQLCNLPEVWVYAQNPKSNHTKEFGRSWWEGIVFKKWKNGSSLRYLCSLWGKSTFITVVKHYLLRVVAFFKYLKPFERGVRCRVRAEWSFLV